MKIKSSAWALLLTLPLLVAGLSQRAPAQAQSPNRAALVVHFGGTTVSRCVSFDEPEISGYDVLTRSGLGITASFDATGAAICAIEATGCPVESCLLCAAPDYWAYWRWDGGQWVYSQLGANATTVRHGAIEGWSWGRGSPPPMIAFDEICAPPSPTATPIPPTATQLPPTPIPPTAMPLPLPEAWFRLDHNPLHAGTCTHVRWDSTHTTAAYLDGEAVPLNGSREVCPTVTQEFTLRVVNIHGERSYDLTLGVLPGTPTPTVTPAPPSRTAMPQPTATATATRTPTPIATQAPPATPTATATPAPTLTETPTATPTATPSALPPTPTPAVAPPSSPVANYVTFALIAGGLLAGLIWRLRRQR